MKPGASSQGGGLHGGVFGGSFGGCIHGPVTTDQKNWV